MIKLLGILWNSFKMALQELKVNKMRTFLSLFGITIGIFCIIGVLATVDSLERKVQSDIKSLGSNTIYIDKWVYDGGGPDYPWWKYLKRPEPKVDEMKFIKQKSFLAANVAFFVSDNTNLRNGDDIITNINMYGVTEDYKNIQDIQVEYGRYLNEADFTNGSPVGVIGYMNAEDLFGKAELAMGKEVDFGGKKVTVIGVIKKQGSSLIGGFDYDRCVIIPYRYFASVYNPRFSSPVILVQGKPQISSTDLKNELIGVMRQIRQLSPTAEDDFTCNDVADFSKTVSGFFSSVNLGGWIIALLSLVVGIFGVANIMFVTVKERTSQIGLKKAVGARKKTILTEFLLESAFLCVIGGLIGLLLVWGLTIGLSSALPFPIIIAPNIITLALTICIVAGVLAGIIPASIAAKMDPVVAIRTK